MELNKFLVNKFLANKLLTTKLGFIALSLVLSCQIFLKRRIFQLNVDQTL